MKLEHRKYFFSQKSVEVLSDPIFSSFLLKCLEKFAALNFQGLPRSWLSAHKCKEKRWFIATQIKVQQVLSENSPGLVDD